MRVLPVLFFLLGMSLMCHSQSVYLSFDNCLVSNAGNLADPEVIGNTSCDCGVEGESLFLEEANSTLQFDSTYTELFQDDFTLSFYFMIQDDAMGIYDIFSVSSECKVDSSMTIKYIADEATVRVQIARDFDLFVEMDAIVNEDMCWHQLVVIRNDENYELYLDGTFADNDFTNGVISLDSSATMRFSNSPCQPFGENPFGGKIDEFKIYDRPLSVEEIFSDYIQLDNVLTSDTTIFTGTSVMIDQTPSCADITSWFPSSTVNQPTDLEPVITPNATTKYRINYEYGICRGQDSVTIAIIDAEAVECENLLVPNAFTPNNDGLNDFIGISNSFIIEELRDFEIFDRWGEKVFATTDKTDQWDGSLREQKLNSNVFLYKVNYTCKGDEYIKTGSFSILR